MDGSAGHVSTGRSEWRNLTLTLPFDTNIIPRYYSDRVLERASKRWDWFVEARRLDATLGTLSYLPVEIRRFVWERMLDCKAPVLFPPLFRTFKCLFVPCMHPSIGPETLEVVERLTLGSTIAETGLATKTRVQEAMLTLMFTRPPDIECRWFMGI